MSAIIFDTETTSVDEPEIVEAAYLPIDITGTVTAEGWCQRFKPSKPISLGALATHHILDEHLIDAPPSSTFRLPDGVEYIVGHSCDFDWTAIGKPNVRRICTLAMSRKLWPDADSHSQSAMLYLLERQTAGELLREAHSAAADVMICQRILVHILAKIRPLVCEDFEDLWKLSEKMRIPDKMTFGKHKGMAIRDVPKDYKRWLLGQPDVDEYLRKALQA